MKTNNFDSSGNNLVKTNNEIFPRTIVQSQSTEIINQIIELLNSCKNETDNQSIEILIKVKELINRLLLCGNVIIEFIIKSQNNLNNLKIDKKISEFSIFSKKDEAKKEETKQNEKGDSALKEQYDDIEKILNNSEIDKEQLKKRVKIYVNNISEKMKEAKNNYDNKMEEIYAKNKVIDDYLTKFNTKYKSLANNNKNLLNKITSNEIMLKRLWNENNLLKNQLKLLYQKQNKINY